MAKWHQRAIEILRSQAKSVYALFDAARDPEILPLLEVSEEYYMSLYQGDLGTELADVAPYLVSLPAHCALLNTLVSSGWDQSWGVFLTSSQDFNAVRSHFRHFLLVEDEDGKELYFRFYDPRVLRVFLPTCTKEEAQQFFGQIESFFMEDEHTERLLQFTLSTSGVSRRIIDLSSTG